MSLVEWLTYAGLLPGLISTIIGAAGTISVLFYRVRKLEEEHQANVRQTGEHEKQFSEIKQAVAAIQQDISWIREKLEHYT